MDPMALVAAAVAAGAAGTSAGLSETAKKAVADAYQALKGLITRRYTSVEVAVVETRPQLRSRRTVLAEELLEAGAGEDRELVDAARYLLQVIEEYAPQSAEVVGVQLRRVRAGELEITDVVSTGTAVVAEETEVVGTLKITGVRSGFPEPPHPPVARQ
ncbi:hypothetical protein ACIBJI_40045 [Nocardia sp. NPDC050408]|uniref:hypothetical protein n=1 Tax=Nocardia sp. NPDC050408 TaxID=3364319 RepID=UPI00378C4673